MLIKRLCLPFLLLARVTVVLGGAVKHDLTPPDGAADTDAKGFVKVKGHKKTGALHLFEVKIKKVDRDATYGVFLEEPVGSDPKEFVQVGEMVVKGKQKDPDNHKAGGAGKFKVNTRKKNNALVLGEGGAEVTLLEELFGRSIEIRNGDEVVLAGLIPAPEEE